MRYFVIFIFFIMVMRILVRLLFFNIFFRNYKEFLFQFFNQKRKFVLDVNIISYFRLKEGGQICFRGSSNLVLFVENGRK